MNENNMIDNNTNDMMMNNFDSFGGDISGETYHAKRPNIQILGPDGKPMAPIPEQNLEDTMIINQPIVGEQNSIQPAPQPAVSNENVSTDASVVPQTPVVEQLPVYTQEDIQIEEPANNTAPEQQPAFEQPPIVTPDVKFNDTSVLPVTEEVSEEPIYTNQQVPNYNPADIQIDEPKMSSEVQPVVEESVTFTSPVETPVSTQNAQESDFYIEEPKQVEQQPVVAQPDMSAVTQSPAQNVEVAVQDAPQPVSTAPEVNAVPTPQPEAAPAPAVNPALRGFTWAQPPVDNGEQQ